MPHFNRTQTLMEKYQGGSRALTVGIKVCELPHSEPVASRNDIKIFRRYKDIMLHSAYDTPSTDLSRR